MRTIMIDGAAKVACPKCSHHFPLSDGLSRQTIERHAEEFERAVAEQSKALERQLVAEKEKALSKFRDEELQLRRRLRELEEADKNRDGTIDRGEYHQAVVESFYFRDKGKKGYLLAEELREASPEAFRAADRKSDGRLTLDEYVNALFIDFDKADTDRDGALTFEEIRVYSRSAR